MEDAAPARRADPLSWAVFGVLAVVYRWGRCPSFGGGDSPAVVYTALFDPGKDPLGLLAHLSTKLPFDTPEGHVNALSGLFHAGAAALLFGLLRRLGLKRVPALAAVALLAFSRRYWYYALVAGQTPAIVFGLALMVWGVVAWKDEGRAWPLGFSLLGALFFTMSPWHSIGAIFQPSNLPAFLLRTPALWCGALVGALILQRVDNTSSKAARLILTGALLIPVMRPYDLRNHNPTLEWAQAAVAPVSKGDALTFSEPSLNYAAAYVCKKRDMHCLVWPLGPLGWMGLSGGGSFVGAYKQEWSDILNAPTTKSGNPDGLLLVDVHSRHLTPLNSIEIARRATAVLELPALSSMGRRDRAKYGFAEEAILCDEYRGILTRYRDLLGPEHAELRARLDAQLAEYGPGPAPKP